MTDPARFCGRPRPSTLVTIPAPESVGKKFGHCFVSARKITRTFCGLSLICFLEAKSFTAAATDVT